MVPNQNPKRSDGEKAQEPAERWKKHGCKNKRVHNSPAQNPTNLIHSIALQNGSGGPSSRVVKQRMRGQMRRKNPRIKDFFGVDKYALLKKKKTE